MNNDTMTSRLHIGLRNIKTCLSVFIILFIYRKLGRENAFLACVAAIVCMRDNVENSVSFGINRLLGTGFGAIIGMVFLYINYAFPSVDLLLLLAPLCVMFTIVACNFLHKPDSVVIGTIMALIIVANETAQTPFIYSINRLLDTLLGIIIAVLVNRFVRNPFSKLSENKK